MNNKGSIIVLLLLLSVIMVGASYMYVYKPKMDEKAIVDSEIVTLKATRDDLQEKASHEEEYKAEIKANYEYFEEQIANYPGTLDQEVAVMFIKDIERDKGNLQFEVTAAGLGREQLFYTLQAPATDENNDEYSCIAAAYPIVYKGSYEGIKDVVDTVMAYKYRMNVSALNIAYDSDKDEYSGTITMNAYAVAGNGRDGEKVDVDLEKGKYNPFIDGDGKSSVITSTHDGDNGDSIASEYDVQFSLNNANGDSTEGIVIADKDGSKLLTSTDNSEVAVDVTVEEVDGKVVAKYTIGSETKEVEVTGSELDIYVKSSARVDSNDVNGVKVTVNNTSDVTVYIKVADDDNSAPRFKMNNKSGKVKVY